MIGAIAGDIIGSIYEFQGTKSADFDLFGAGCGFTDDTVLTVAVADCVLHKKDYAATLKEYGHRYPRAGYGGMFRKWLNSVENQPYNSYGNGSAMRVSAIGWAYPTLAEVLVEAERSAAVTHNHPEGIKGAQAVASAIFLARRGSGKNEIRSFIEERFGYDLKPGYAEIQARAAFDETCQVSVPQALIAFLDSSSFEDAVRKAVALAGDADTQACIAGGIAEAFYRPIPTFIVSQTRRKLDQRLLMIVDEFTSRYCQNP